MEPGWPLAHLLVASRPQDSFKCGSWRREPGRKWGLTSPAKVPAIGQGALSPSAAMGQPWSSGHPLMMMREQTGEKCAFLVGTPPPPPGTAPAALTLPAKPIRTGWGIPLPSLRMAVSLLRAPETMMVVAQRPDTSGCLASLPPPANGTNGLLISRVKRRVTVLAPRCHWIPPAPWWQSGLQKILSDQPRWMRATFGCCHGTLAPRPGSNRVPI